MKSPTKITTKKQVVKVYKQVVKELNRDLAKRYDKLNLGRNGMTFFKTLTDNENVPSIYFGKFFIQNLNEPFEYLVGFDDELIRHPSLKKCLTAYAKAYYNFIINEMVRTKFVLKG